MKDVYVRITCRLCDGALREVLDLGHTCLANELDGVDEFPLYLSACESCGHVQLPVIVNPERLFRDYVYQSGTAPSFVKHLHDFARDVQPKARGFVVEIGSNDGTLLAEYRRLGFEVMGVDPAHNVAHIAETVNRVPTIRDFFTKRLLESNWNLVGRKADLIVANNVFAHADDLACIAEGVAELLADDGVFVFEVGYLPDVIERGLYRVIYHEHLSYHHLRPLFAFFGRFGLFITDAQRVSTQGGSVRVFARKVSSKLSDGLSALIDAETPVALDVSRLSAKIANDKARIRAVLSERTWPNMANICGYGAPAQLTTTCAVLGITREDIAFICDDNPLKVGRTTPGTHIPIVEPSRLYDADICVIFSANFADEIMKRHEDWEGEWIVL